MVRLSIATGDELETIRRWTRRFRTTRVARPLESLYTVCIHCSLLLAAIGASKVAVVSLLLSIPINAAALVAFLVTLAVYTHNNLTDFAEDGLNDPERASFFGQRRRLFAGIAVGAYLVALCLSALGGPEALALTLFPGVLGVLYSSRWLPGSGPDRLKDVLGIGTVAVALAWAVPLGLLPLAFSDRGFGAAALFVLVFFFLRTVLAVELFNVRDVAGDRQEGVGTLPVAFGIASTRRALGAMNLASLVVLVWAVLAGVLTQGAFAAAAGLAYSQALVVLLGSYPAERLCLANYLEPPLMLAALAITVGI